MGACNTSSNSSNSNPLAWPSLSSFFYLRPLPAPILAEGKGLPDCPQMSVSLGLVLHQLLALPR